MLHSGFFDKKSQISSKHSQISGNFTSQLLTKKAKFQAKIVLRSCKKCQISSKSDQISAEIANFLASNPVEIRLPILA